MNLPAVDFQPHTHSDGRVCYTTDCAFRQENDLQQYDMRKGPFTSDRYEIYDYNWSGDRPALTTNSFSQMREMIKEVSEGCVYENGFKKYEILDGKIEVDYSRD